jgi:hypothetical protein
MGYPTDFVAEQAATYIPVITGTYQPTVLDAMSPAVVQSPYNWSEGRVGPGSLQSISPGAYLRFYFTNCINVTLLFDPSSSGCGFRLLFDNGVLSPVFSVPVDGKVPISFPDAESHSVTLLLTSLQVDGADRWQRETFCGVLGLQLGEGGHSDVNSVVRGKRNVLIYGDSITEGHGANNGHHDVTCSYAYYVAESLRHLEFEYGIVACSGQGYLKTGVGATPAFSIAWNKIDASHSRLSNGLLKPLPDIIIDNHGVNDQNALMLPSVITAFYRILRQAAPSAHLFKVQPFSGAWRKQIQTAINSYKSSSQDQRISLLDLNIDNRILSGLYTGFGDNVHPGVWGNANIGSLLITQILREYLS